MKNKNGFTLIELLAVIAVLAIILVIATSSVIGTIKTSRTNVFVETMEMGVKNAKSVLATKGTLDTKSLKESMDYKENQYVFEVENVKIGDKSYYRIILSPAHNSSKFKNIDFSSLSDQEKDESMFGYNNDKKEIYAFISKENGKLVSASPNGNEVVDSGDGDTPGDNTSGGGSDDGDTPTTPEEVKKIGGDAGSCKAMEKKDSYSTADIIYFCNKENENNGYKEEFHIMSSYKENDIKYYKLFSDYGLSSTGFQSKSNAETVSISSDSSGADALSDAEEYGKKIGRLLGLGDNAIKGTISDYTVIVNNFGLDYVPSYGITFYDIKNYDWLLPPNKQKYWASSKIHYENYSGGGHVYYLLSADYDRTRLQLFSIPIREKGISAQVRPTIIVPASAIEANN